MSLRDWLNQDIVPPRSRLSELYPGKVWHYLVAIIAGITGAAGFLVGVTCCS